jgi:hypothetical protein
MVLAMSRASLDVSRFPLVTLTEHAGLRDDERVEVTEAPLALLGRSPHVLIFDLTHGSALPDSQRRYVGEQFDRHAHEMRAKWLGLAVMVREPLLTNVPIGAFWLRVTKVPARVFTQATAALTWAQEHLGQPVTGTFSISSSPPGARGGSR